MSGVDLLRPRSLKALHRLRHHLCHSTSPKPFERPHRPVLAPTPLPETPTTVTQGGVDLSLMNF